ncbi:cell wall-binding repeat-containing protein [Georgenia yuyongxinii]|uniref:cell wall-binding repeat-containing protein n=1 Tax=Georgenia yuyongxinii TaxID=2589797 RepID=UPI00143E0D84|nr:cell wall-binding repeat-containing protein [Georgenia yuyongxinii]
MTAEADEVIRIHGDDRIDTAVAASQAQRPHAFAPGTGTVIVTRSDDFPDALTAVPLADQLDAPILITPSGKALDDRVATEIRRLSAAHVVIAGGPGTVSVTAEEDLGAIVGAQSVHRIAGPDRYATAAALALWTITSAGQGESTAPPDPATMGPNEEWEQRRDTPVFLATGLDYPDALAAGAAAAQVNGVVLLTKGDQLDLHSHTGPWRQRGYTQSFMLGEEGEVITGPVYTVGGPATKVLHGRGTSFVGKDRYETAALVARSVTFFPDGVRTIAVASGEDFADAVVASGFVANRDGPLLLTRADSLPAATASYLASVSSPETTSLVRVFGGPGAVAPGVVASLSEAIS